MHEDTLQARTRQAASMQTVEKLSVWALIGSQIEPTRAPRSDLSSQIEPTRMAKSKHAN